MTDLKDLVRAVSELRSRNKEFLVATVVRTSDPARKPGARILLSEDRWIAGAVSGDLDGLDRRERSLWLVPENAPALVEHDATLGDDDLSFALGVGETGSFEMLVEHIGPLTALDPIVFIERCLQAQLRGAMATVCRTRSQNVQVGSRLCLTSDGVVESTGLPSALTGRLEEACRHAIETGQTALHTYDEGGVEVDVLVEAFVPPPRLFLFGSGHDAAPVANLARAVGWDVYVCVRRAREQTRARFAPAEANVVASAENIRTLIRSSENALALVMTHDDRNDQDALSLLLRSPIRYIGISAPPRRARALLEGIGYDIDADPRVHPLRPGADTPEEVAIALIAEIQAALRLPLPPARPVRPTRGRAVVPGGDEPSVPSSRRAPIDYEPASHP